MNILVICTLKLLLEGGVLITGASYKGRLLFWRVPGSLNKETKNRSIIGFAILYIFNGHLILRMIILQHSKLLPSCKPSTQQYTISLCVFKPGFLAKKKKKKKKIKPRFRKFRFQGSSLTLSFDFLFTSDCSGNSCLVTAGASTFSLSCGRIHDYLQVYYRCVPE